MSSLWLLTPRVQEMCATINDIIIFIVIGINEEGLSGALLPQKFLENFPQTQLEKLIFLLGGLIWSYIDCNLNYTHQFFVGLRDGYRHQCFVIRRSLRKIMYLNDSHVNKMILNSISINVFLIFF